MLTAIPAAAGVFALIGGGLSLLGWILSLPRLIDWNNDGIGIKANPAICIMLAGLGLLTALFAPGKRWLIRVIGLAVAVIAGLTLSQHLTGTNLGIDTLLFTEPPGAKATTSPGRMGLPASTALTIVGIALILSSYRRLRSWTPTLGIAVLAISSLSLVGYLFGVNELFEIPRLTAIALQTATMVAALAIGLVTVVPEYGFVASMSRKDAGGTVLRRLFIPLIVISLVLGWLRIVGQEAGLYDTAFGTAVRTLVEIALLLGLLWWTARDISRSEARLRDVTSALAERDERMSGVLEALSDAFISFDRDLRFAYVNASAKQVFTDYGANSSELIGRNFFEVFPEAINTALGRALVDSMKKREPGELEEYYEPVDRSYHVRYLPTADGGVSMFALDITERKQVERDIGRRARELAVLYGFADRLNRSASLSEVYDGALDAITNALGCNRASILLFDDAGVMRFVAARGLSPDYQKAVEGHSPWKQGETAAKPIAIVDIAAAADLDEELRTVIEREGIGSLGFIPLIANEVLIGKFMVYFNEPHEFSDAEFELAMTVAYQIAFGVERRRTEQSLRDNEERLRLATLTGRVGVWDWDVRANRVEWTEPVYEMHGVKPGEFGGRVEDFAGYIHPDDRVAVRQRIDAALAGDAAYETDFRVVHPDGEVRWLFTNALIMRDETGPYRMIGATIDVTDRKLAEQQFAILAAIVDSSSDAIVSKDVNGVIKSWNPGAERLFGFTPDEAIGRPVTILIPDDRQDEETEILSRIRKGEYIEHYETVRRRKDGTLLEISLSVSPVRDGNGTIVGASKIARDITQRRRTETAIRDREIMHRLVEAQEAERNRIARDLHDHLGQQLTALRLKLGSIRAQCKDEALAREVDVTQEYASRIDMDINYLAWELRPTELDQLGLRDALGSFVREWSKTYDIEAEFHASTNPKQRLHPEIETNLYRILQEALNNILKHANATSVNVLLEQRDDRIGLIIEDNGRGFESEERVDSTNGSKGLGLVGMRERAALLGGTLDIESRPGEGTTLFARVSVRLADQNGDGDGVVPNESPLDA